MFEVKFTITDFQKFKEKNLIIFHMEIFADVVGDSHLNLINFNEFFLKGVFKYRVTFCAANWDL